MICDGCHTKVEMVVSKSFYFLCEDCNSLNKALNSYIERRMGALQRAHDDSTSLD